MTRPTVAEVNYSNPAAVDSQYEVGAASGTLEINPGDYVSYSGQHLIASHDGIAYFKASGAGIAVDRSPSYDKRGVAVTNSALIYARWGKFVVSANFSGQPNLGVLAYPDMTGSGVNAPSGNTGLGALWQTAAPVRISANPTGAPSFGVAQVVGWKAAGNGGTGQLTIRLWENKPDYI